jgi:hypothetical protein
MLPVWVKNAYRQHLREKNSRGQRACMTAKDLVAAMGNTTEINEKPVIGIFDSTWPSTMIPKFFTASWPLLGLERSMGHTKGESGLYRS